MSNRLLIQKGLYKEKVGNYVLLYNPYSDKDIIVVRNSLLTPPSNLKEEMRFSKTDLMMCKELGLLDINRAKELSEKLIEHDILVKAERDRPSAIHFEDVLSVWIDVTNQCNFRCTYCFVEKKTKLLEPTALEKALKHIVEYAVSKKFSKIRFIVAGGEPLLYFDRFKSIIEVINSEVKRTGLFLSIQTITNASLLTVKRVRYLAQKKIRVGISLDGLKKTNDRVRIFSNRMSTFNQTIQGIGIAKQHNILNNVIVTLTKENYAELPDLITYLVQHNIHFALQFYKKTGILCQKAVMKPGRNFISVYKKTLRRVYELYQEKGMTESPLEKNLLLENFTLPNNPVPYACGAGRNFFAVSTDGSFRFCPQAPNRFYTKLETLLKQNRQLIQNNFTFNTECNTCQWRYICGNGCRLERLFIDKNLTNISPRCSFYKEIVPFILKLEARHRIKQNLFV